PLRRGPRASRSRPPIPRGAACTKARRVTSRSGCIGGPTILPAVPAGSGWAGSAEDPFARGDDIRPEGVGLIGSFIGDPVGGDADRLGLVASLRGAWRRQERRVGRDEQAVG